MDLSPTEMFLSASLNDCNQKYLVEYFLDTPEIEAEFFGGYQEMTKYLKENVI